MTQKEGGQSWYPPPGNVSRAQLLALSRVFTSKLHFTYRVHSTRGRNRRSFTLSISLLQHGSIFESDPTQPGFPPHCYQRAQIHRCPINFHHMRHERHFGFTHNISRKSRGESSSSNSKPRFNRHRETNQSSKSHTALLTPSQRGFWRMLRTPQTVNTSENGRKTCRSCYLVWHMPSSEPCGSISRFWESVKV